MKCNHISKKLNSFFDGETPLELTNSIKDHLANCPRCSSELEKINSLSGILQPQAVPPLPDGFADAVMREVRRIVPSRNTKFQPVLWWRDLSFSLQAVSVALVCLFVGLGVFMGESLTGMHSESTLDSNESADAVILSLMQPLNETGAESLADTYLYLSNHNKRRH
jgi:anti-sigma factor RsiW